jgi:hypothetical protein
MVLMVVVLAMAEAAAAAAAAGSSVLVSIVVRCLIIRITVAQRTSHSKTTGTRISMGLVSARRGVALIFDEAIAVEVTRRSRENTLNRNVGRLHNCSVTMTTSCLFPSVWPARLPCASVYVCASASVCRTEGRRRR